MSARVFIGKLFRVLTVTVRPKHRIAGDDGKMRPGPFLPESFWYSKVSCILSLEASNEKIVPITPVIVTDFSPKPFSSNELPEGEVGRRELGDGSKQGIAEFAVRDGNHHNAPPPTGEGEKSSLPVPSPQSVTPQSHDCHAKLERDKEILRARGFLL
jgi:hypothetical protein